ncbi:ArnT family glycosyltransferase [Noviherbaspirillum galbum]|uniref:Glycosyltransferase n=1 Tax=Noviherbaspirillum galbum TaxID=2709383 RepID=A0A6B3SIN8_9BURK|nr:glycosyltransferase [Noviherbaspirillum galbum]NEX60563.1 glycosyltransferase [Noviherbaspirillum galbum]
MKPVRLPAAATNALPRWMLLSLCMLYILPGLIRRDPWKTQDDASGFGIMWTMAHGTLNDWLWPHIVGLPMPDKGPLAYWIGALCIKLFGPLLGDDLAARISTIGFFLLGCIAVWYTTYLLGRRPETQPLKLAFGGQPEPRDYGRTLADGALLIYLGCLGLLLHSHSTSAEALQVSLVATAMYAAVRLFDSQSLRHAAWLGAVFGLLVLTRGWVFPLAAWTGLLVLACLGNSRLIMRLCAVTLPVAVLVAATWILACRIERPFNSSPFDAWMVWNYRQISLPSLESLHYLLKYGIWFAWPAWPFAGWAIYAWRRQYKAWHITLPLTFLVSAVVVALVNPHPEEGMLLAMLPPLAMLAAFGLPTMKRGAINAVDWFSVMTLSFTSAFVWLAWIAKQTGWPGWLARNALKLVPGFKPEFNLIACLIATVATIGWLALVQWRISRRPSVLWRAVVLSSGGVILCWVLLMTLWLPWINYYKSYEGVARRIGENIVPAKHCVDSNVGPAQRASFAYFGGVPFAGFNDAQCDYLLLQDNRNGATDNPAETDPGKGKWKLLWEGRRPSDRDERYRLYQRIH